jgi:hypothetical protein
MEPTLLDKLDDIVSLIGQKAEDLREILKERERENGKNKSTYPISYS